MKTGDILYSAWGYEQTNVDFYEVIEATAKTVVVREIEKEKIYSSDMTGDAVPVPGKYIGEPIRRKIASWSNGKAIKINPLINAYLYENKPVAFSEYA